MDRSVVENKWRGVYEEFVSSGKSASAFCREKEISATSFQHWKSLFGKSQCDSPKKVQPLRSRFVPVEISNINRDPRSIVRLPLPDARWVAEIILNIYGGAR